MRIMRVVIACLFTIAAAWIAGADEEIQNLVTNPDFSRGSSEKADRKRIFIATRERRSHE